MLLTRSGRASLVLLAAAAALGAAGYAAGADADGAEALQQAMREGHKAMPADPAKAEEAFVRALALAPDSPTAADGLAQARRLRIDAELQLLLREAQALMGAEDWTGALAAHKRMAALSPQGADLDAVEHLAKLVDLERQLDRYLSRPERLELPAGRRRASAMTADEDGVGVRIAGKIAALRKMLEAGGPARARLVLDVRHCESVRLAPGRDLGRVRGEVSIDAVPGRYQIIGLRSGHREFRSEVSLAPGASLRRKVVCNERI